MTSQALSYAIKSYALIESLLTFIRWADKKVQIFQPLYCLLGCCLKQLKIPKYDLFLFVRLISV